MRSRKFYVFLVIYFLFLSVIVFNFYPEHDDWSYAAPIPGMNLTESLKPSVIFWRPFHNIVSYVLGYIPSFFPYLNHCLGLFSHLVLCIFLYKVLAKVTRDNFALTIGLLFFCLSPGIVYPVSDTDIFEHGLAMVSGLAAVLCFFKAKTKGRYYYYLLWFMFAFGAVMFRENGLSWFLASVMLFMVYSYSERECGISTLIKENSLHIFIAAAGMILYFALRFYLLGSIRLGAAEGRYSVNLSPLNIIKNYCLIIGSAVTSADAIAIFVKPRNYPVIVITAVISLMFLGYIFICLRRIFISDRKTFNIIAGLFVCAGYISSSFAVIDHVGDNTTYEMVLMCALILGIILSSCRPRKFIEFAVIAVMLISMFCVQGHKFYVSHMLTAKIHAFIDEHKHDFSNKPSKVFVYFIADVPEEGYSIYHMSLGKGLNSGTAFKTVWGWETKFTVREINSEAEIDFTPENLPEYDTVFSLTRSGILKVLRN